MFAIAFGVPALDVLSYMKRREKRTYIYLIRHGREGGLMYAGPRVTIAEVSLRRVGGAAIVGEVKNMRHTGLRRERNRAAGMARSTAGFLDDTIRDGRGPVSRRLIFAYYLEAEAQAAAAAELDAKLRHGARVRELVREIMSEAAR
jgi:hypothetical protein